MFVRTDLRVGDIDLKGGDMDLKGDDKGSREGLGRHRAVRRGGEVREWEGRGREEKMGMKGGGVLRAFRARRMFAERNHPRWLHHRLIVMVSFLAYDLGVRLVAMSEEAPHTRIRQAAFGVLAKGK